MIVYDQRNILQSRQHTRVILCGRIVWSDPAYAIPSPLDQAIPRITDKRLPMLPHSNTPQDQGSQALPGNRLIVTFSKVTASD